MRICVSHGLVFALVAACEVAPPDTGVDGGGVVGDGGPGIIACSVDTPCPEGLRCVRTGSSTVAAGQEGICGDIDVACTSDDECGLLRFCTAIGVCAPVPVRFTASVDRQPDFQLECVDDDDCGGRLCVSGVCKSCTSELTCPSDAPCFDGRCLVDFCLTDSECPGNMDCVERRCSAACAEEGFSFEVFSGVVDGLTICPGEVERFFVTATPDEAWLFVLSAEEASVELDATVVDGMGPVDLSMLRLPGLLAFQVPAASSSDPDRIIEASVTSTSGFVPYQLLVESVSCAEDALTMLGDSSVPLVDSEAELALRLCGSGARTLRAEIPAGPPVIQSGTFPAAAEVSAEVLVLSGSLTGGVSEDDDIGRFQRQYAFDADGESGLQLTFDLSDPSGANLDVSSRVQLRDGVASDPVLTNVPLSADLGGATCAFEWPTGPHDALIQLPPPTGEEDRLTLEVAPSDGDPGILFAALLSNPVESETLACETGLAPGIPARFDLQTDADTLFVSGDRAGLSVDVSAERRAVPAPDNDSCLTSALVPASGVFETTVSTFGGTDTVSNVVGEQCADPGPSDGSDRFFTFNLNPGQRVEVSLEGPPGGYLWVNRDCAVPADTCLFADSLTVRERTVRTSVSAELPEAIFAIVEAEGEADFTLRMAFDPECTIATETSDCAAGTQCSANLCTPPPPNDGCPGIPLQVVNGRASVQASNEAALSGLDTPGIEDGPDLFYSVVVPDGTEQLIARVVEATFDPALVVRFQQCGASGGQRVNLDIASDQQPLPQVLISDPPPGTYFVVVESQFGEGSFDLEVLLQ
ncbi:MAG: hypothetical protein ACFB9M_20510 [Myxococcota bacterium]